MIGLGLRKLAEEYQLQVSKGIAYGEVEGYILTLSEGMGTKTLCVSTLFPDEGAKGSLYMELNSSNLRNKYYIQRIEYGDRDITVQFMDRLGTMKRFREFIELFMPRLAQSGAQGADYCPLCRQPLQENPSILKKINGIVHRVHTVCTAEITEKAARENEAHLDEPKNYSRGALGALLGAIVGAIPWAIVYSFGWFVAYLGLLIGFTAKKGYELLGGKVGKGKFWIILPATLAGVIIGNLAGDIISIFKMVAAGEIPGATYGDIPDIFVFILRNGEYLRPALISIGMGCFFALLGIIGILRDIRTEHKKSVMLVEDVE